MKRSSSAVKFAEPEDSTPTSSSSRGVRYGRILQGFTGSHTSEPAAEGTKKVFNPSAAPAKPAMKSSRSHTDLTAVPQYPEVDKDGNPISYQQPGQQANPATGLVGYQTRGGAALASALGVQDGMANIPPACPPALPTTTATVPAHRPPVLGRNSSEEVVPRVTGSVSNPLAVPDMPLMAPVPPTASKPAAAAAAEAGADLQLPMPPAAMADGTVQLYAGGYTSGGVPKLLQAATAADAGATGQQRDQGDRVAAQLLKHGVAAGGWESVAVAVAPHHKQDIESPEPPVSPVSSPTAAAKAVDYDDDASRWVPGMLLRGAACLQASRIIERGVLG